MLKLGTLLILSLVCSCALASAVTSTSYEREIQSWREERLARLKAPEGWLSLVGLLWLQEGSVSIGSAETAGLRLPSGPALLGQLKVSLEDAKVSLALAKDVEASIDGGPAREADLRNDTQGRPTVVRSGSLSFIVIKRGPKLGLRVRDSESKNRREFPGIENYPTDVAWRVEARWVPFEPARKLAIANVLGQVSEELAPGKAVFERDGKTWELIPTQEDDGELFFVFRDGTSGMETYGASRFLTAAAPRDGKVLLDFNKAYNPPCAFSEFATCPLPIRENVIKLPIRAGEKKPAGHE